MDKNPRESQRRTKVLKQRCADGHRAHFATEFLFARETGCVLLIVRKAEGSGTERNTRRPGKGASARKGVRRGRSLSLSLTHSLTHSLPLSLFLSLTHTPQPRPDHIPQKSALSPCSPVCYSMASSSKATLILLIYGILMHYSVFCTPIGLSYPKIRLENDAFDEDGNSLNDMGFDSDQIAIRSPASLNDDAYSLYYPPEKRPERHAEEELDRALREILGQLTARHYLHSLMTVRAGEDNSMEDESEPLSKRHSDGIFTDSYSRYRKQMAVQKYLAAVLGRRYRQRVRNKGRRLAYL